MFWRDGNSLYAEAFRNVLLRMDLSVFSQRICGALKRFNAALGPVSQVDQGLTQANCGDLEKHAYSVNDGIADGDLRNAHILAGV